MEEVGFNYAQIEVRYTPIGPDGKPTPKSSHDGTGKPIPADNVN